MLGCPVSWQLNFESNRYITVLEFSNNSDYLPLMKFPLLLSALLFLAVSTNGLSADRGEPSGHSLVFIHPDGTGLAGWNIYRILDHGPDGTTNWDQLPELGVYRPHVKNNLDPSSHAGATIHSYGVKVVKDSYGMDGKKPIRAANGYAGSVMHEARDAGLAVGIINSGHLAEPGTAVMLASVESRSMRVQVASQLIASNADLIMGGGEILFLPIGTQGRHGREGIRQDGRNLVKEAESEGYRIIYTKEELNNIPSTATKVLGLFAAEDTYNIDSEEGLARSKKPIYIKDAPTVAEMTKAGLKWLKSQKKPYFLMIEEEGTDNFANNTNAAGMMEAFRRSDAAIGAVMDQVKLAKNLTLLVAADSEAGCPELIPLGRTNSSPDEAKMINVPKQTKSGASIDGVGGTGSAAFLSAPDRFGQRHYFGIAWTDPGDHTGSVLVRAAGARGNQLPANVDNTEIYHFIRRVIFK